MNKNTSTLKASHKDKQWTTKYVADPDICEINPSYSLTSGKPYPFVAMENVLERCEGISGFETRILDSGGYTTFKNGDILFAKITPCTENGKIAMVNNMPEDVGFGSTEFIVFSPKPAIDSRFLFYQLTRGDVRALCSSLMEGTTGRQRVPISIFRKLIQIPVPPSIGEQTFIADTIEKMDFGIAAVRDSIAKSERLQKVLMQQLLTGRLRPDGTVRTKDEFHDTMLGLLPKVWTVARVKAFGDVTTGKTPPTENEMNFGTDYQFITPGDLGSPKWIAKTERSLSAQGSVHAGTIPKNAVCIVCIGATIGKIGLTVRSSCTNQQINSVVCSNDHDPEYLYYALRYRARYLQLIAGVNATPQLNKTEFSKYKLPMPQTLKEEREIAKQLAVFDDLIETKKQKIIALQRLKKSLMQNLLTGRIRLSIKKLKAQGVTT